MTVEIDNAELVEGELVNFNGNTEVIENVRSVHITKNNKYIAITTPEHTGFNAILVDMTRFNIHITNVSAWK